MSWLFSRALVAEYSAGTCSGGAQSAPLSVMPTQHKFWRNDKTMEHSRLSQFGLTCAVLTADHGEALLMSYLAASHARTSQQLAPEPVLPALDRGFGVRWLESSVKYDLDSSSWKTHHCLWDEDLPWSSVILPKWGMTKNGLVYRHPTRERPISGTEYGCWPTPVASDTAMRTKKYAQGGTPLSLAVGRTLWPTPTVHGNHNQPGSSKTAGWGLSSAAKMWRTPNASDATKWSNQSEAERKQKGQQLRLNTQVSPDGGSGGQLNPTWVEWLMGWPIGWTDLRPLEMDKFHEWQRQHSPCSPANAEEAA